MTNQELQVSTRTQRQLEAEVERLQSIIECVQADLHAKDTDKTAVYWRLHERLVKYAKDFP